MAESDINPEFATEAEDSDKGMLLQCQPSITTIKQNSNLKHLAARSTVKTMLFSP
jgi:hypothetical protein